MNDNFDRNITYFEVVTKDLVSYLLGIFYLFYIALIVVFSISLLFFGTNAPEESPLEIVLGSAIITAIFLIVLKFRISKITEMLRSGERVNAKVIQSLSYQFFVHIRIKYKIDEKIILKKLLLPNTGSCRALMQKQDLTVGLLRNKIKNLVVYNLYTQYQK